MMSYDDRTYLVIEIMNYDVYIKIESQLPNLEVFIMSLMSRSRYIRFTRAGLQKPFQELVGLFSPVNLKKIILKSFITIILI